MCDAYVLAHRKHDWAEECTGRRWSTMPLPRSLPALVQAEASLQALADGAGEASGLGAGEVSGLGEGEGEAPGPGEASGPN